MALYNINNIIPQLSQDNKLKIVKNSFIKLFENIFILMKIQKFSKEELEKICKIEGAGNFENALRLDKGVIVISGHFGNWELPVILPLFYPEADFITIGKRQKPEFLNNFLFELRENFGSKVTESKNALVPVYKTLRRKGVAGFIIDQRSKKKDSVTVDFFGKKIPCTSAPAYFALKTGAPVLFCFTEKMENRDGYILNITEEIKLDRDKDKDFNTLLQINTQILHDKIADRILRNPDNWYWLHSKFKSKRRVLKEIR